MIGIDVVDLGRFRAAIERSDGLEERLFTKSERAYCESRSDPVLHLAGTFAAKEAVIKAARLGSLVAWARRIEVTRRAGGAPEVTVSGRSDLEVAVSISHDGSWAAATAMLGRSRNENLRTWLT